MLATACSFCEHGATQQSHTKQLQFSCPHSIAILPVLRVRRAGANLQHPGLHQIRTLVCSSASSFLKGAMRCSILMHLVMYGCRSGHTIVSPHA